jgi:Rap1a immunity proteins
MAALTISGARKASEIVLESLHAHPETRQDAAAGEVARALKQAFPCK